MTRSTALLHVCALLVVLATGCGGGALEGVGTSRPPREAEAVDLALRTADGAFIDLAGLRGKPVVLFLFATYDVVSQAATQPLARFHRIHGADAHVIAIAIQPNAAELVGPWAQALDTSLTVTYEPEPQILAGATNLGTIAGIPSYIVLDADGVVVARHVGFASENKLARLLDTARVR